MPESFRLPFFVNIDTSTLTITTGTLTYAMYLGKASAAHSSAEVIWEHTAAATTVTWAEVAIATGAFPSDDSEPVLTVRGFTDIAAVLTGAPAVNTTTVALTGVEEGAGLWVVWGRSGGTGNATVRATNPAMASSASPLFKQFMPTTATQPQSLSATTMTFSAAVTQAPFMRVRLTDEVLTNRDLSLATPFGIPVQNNSGISIGTATRSWAVYVGRAEAAYTSADISFFIPSGAASSVTWAEVGVATGDFPSGTAVPVLTNRGTADISASVIAGAGTYQHTVSLSGISAGDGLWLVIGRSGGAGSYNLQAGTVQALTTGMVRQFAPTVLDRPSLLSGTSMIFETNGGHPQLIGRFST